MKKSLFLSLALMLSTALWAQDNIEYIDVYGRPQYMSKKYVTEVTSSTSQVTWNNTWYFVTGEVSLSKGVICKNNVNLILADGATLIVTSGEQNAGIEVSGADDVLSIYGQTMQTGQLIAIGGDNSAGIGGGRGYSGNNINIYGGVITAKGGSSGAGIGGGFTGSCHNIFVNGGTVTATGGYGAAGIGCGASAYSFGLYPGDIRNVVFNGGTITAIGGAGASGIGCGFEGGDAKEIYASPNLIVKADNNNPPTTVIEHASIDMASSLQGKQYVTMEPLIIPVSTTYIDENGAEQTINAFEVKNASELVTWGREGQTTWYVVKGDNIQLAEGAVCRGDVHLILADGSNLNASSIYSKAAIEVSGADNAITIYGQAKQTGYLFAQPSYDGGAGIGGSKRQDGNNITINGGVIFAEGKDAAGIGGGYEGAGRNIIINAGNVTAKGAYMAAGIGGGVGYNGGASHGSKITINGGTVTATGGDYGAGIGGGRKGNGTDITINGGTVETTGGYLSAGIGGGDEGSGSNITINGGSVTARAGTWTAAFGSGYEGAEASKIFVGDGYWLKSDKNNPPTTIIEHASVTDDIAKKLTGEAHQNAIVELSPIAPAVFAAISAIRDSAAKAKTQIDNIALSVEDIPQKAIAKAAMDTALVAPLTAINSATTEEVINEAKQVAFVSIAQQVEKVKTYLWTSAPYIDANGNEQTCKQACMIVNNTAAVTWTTGWYVVLDTVELSKGAVCQGNVHLILADGAKLTATGGALQAGVQVSGKETSFTIYGQVNQTGVLEATGGGMSAGIGGGQYSSGSHITINGGIVTAKGGTGCGAGIGGGDQGSGSYITINGGTVTATGTEWSAGIGGGDQGSGSHITINGGKVTASGNLSAGIGGGRESYGSNITINGGEVIAKGGLNAACIGSGYQGSKASNIFVADNLVVKADNTNPPTTEIEHTITTDIASSLAGKRYATIVFDPITIARIEAIAAIQQAATKAKEEIAAIFIPQSVKDAANTAIDVAVTTAATAIHVATTEEEINTAKQTALDAIAQSVNDVKAFVMYDIPYIDANGEEQNCAQAQIITNADTVLTWAAGWYVVNGADVTLSQGAVCQGDVRLILADGAKLTASGLPSPSNTAGINVTGDGNSLAIYAQSTGDQMGQLIAIGVNYAAGIGGGQYVKGSNITINGGLITATGEFGSAGIGGGQFGDGFNITINGGIVNANGGESGSAIGGGQYAKGSNITINGGTVTAICKYDNGSSCIGSGKEGEEKADASNIFVADGLLVKADNNNPPTTIIEHASITEDLSAKFAKKRCATIVFDSLAPTRKTAVRAVNEAKDAAITAINNASSEDYVQSIKTTAIAIINNITTTALSQIGDVTTEDAINTLKAEAIDDINVAKTQALADIQAKIDLYDNQLVAIQAVQDSATNAKTRIDNIVIPEEEMAIKATAKEAIDAVVTTATADINIALTEEAINEAKQSAFASIALNVDKVRAKMIVSVSYINANGVEQTCQSAKVVANATNTVTWTAGWYVVMDTVLISKGVVCQGDVHLILADGAKLTASSLPYKAAIEVSGEGNAITIYGQTEQTGYLKAQTGAYRGAGIGGSNEQDGNNITINGGVILAVGIEAAGIGGGYEAAGRNIIINGGTVTANGGAWAAGIGGGKGYTGGANQGSNIIINGGIVKANGGDEGAGIGGGRKGYGTNITINGGEVIAKGGRLASAIGSGSGDVESSNIFVADGLLVKADKNNPPTTLIEHASITEDIAGKLTGASHQNVIIELSPVASVGIAAITAIRDSAANAKDEIAVITIAQEIKDTATTAIDKAMVAATTQINSTLTEDIIEPAKLTAWEVFGQQVQIVRDSAALLALARGNALYEINEAASEAINQITNNYMVDYVQPIKDTAIAHISAIRDTALVDINASLDKTEVETIKDSALAAIEAIKTKVFEDLYAETILHPVRTNALNQLNRAANNVKQQIAEIVIDEAVKTAAVTAVDSALQSATTVINAAKTEDEITTAKTMALAAFDAQLEAVNNAVIQLRDTKSASLDTIHNTANAAKTAISEAATREEVYSLRDAAIATIVATDSAATADINATLVLAQVIAIKDSSLTVIETTKQQALADIKAVLDSIAEEEKALPQAKEKALAAVQDSAAKAFEVVKYLYVTPYVVYKAQADLDYAESEALSRINYCSTVAEVDGEVEFAFARFAEIVAEAKSMEGESEAKIVPLYSDSTIVTPTEEDVTLTWPIEEDAATYTVIITEEGDTIYVAKFDADGRRTDMGDEEPSMAAARMARAATATEMGYQYTVLGLEKEVHYGYKVISQTVDNTVIYQNGGGFMTSTDPTPTGINTLPYEGKVGKGSFKVMENHRFFIIRDGKVYSIMGVGE